MRIWLVVILSALFGGAAGAGSILWNFDPGSARRELASQGPKPVDARMPEAAPTDGPQPRIAVDNVHFDFGQMERSATGRHTFLIKNIGDYPLRLRKGDTTCKCTLSELAERDIPPGGTGEVTLEWKAKSAEVLFRQSATIFTNDPNYRSITLTVEGILIQSLTVSPPEVVFSNLTRDEQATAKTELYTQLQEDLQVVGHVFEEADTAAYFDVQTKPLGEGNLPPGEKGGLQVLVTVKPGLPPGPIRQAVRLQTNLADIPDPVISIQGTIGNGVLIVGGGWDPDHGVLRLGTVSKQTGGKWDVKLLIRGPHRQGVRFAEPKANPDVLQVRLGEPVDLGSVVQVPMTITIPPGSPNVSRTGSKQGGLGEITIDSDREQVGQVRILVQFAVAG